MPNAQQLHAIRQRIASERRIAKHLYNRIYNQSLRARLQIVLDTLDHIDRWAWSRKKSRLWSPLWIGRFQAIVMLAIDERIVVERIANQQGIYGGQVYRRPAEQMSQSSAGDS